MALSPTVSPGYEVNDIGFENRADYHSVHYSLMYQESSPSPGFLRYYNFWHFSGHSWNHGGDLINSWYNIGADIEFSLLTTILTCGTMNMMTG